MKKILGLLMMLVSLQMYGGTTSVDAQEEKGFFVGLDAGKRVISEISNKMVLYPSIGYQINSDWSLGIRTQIDFSDINFIYLGGYVQYNFLKFNKLNLFSEGKISLFYPIPGMRKDMNRVTEVGVNLGASYELFKKLKLNLRYLYLGYCSMPYWDLNDRYPLRVGKFILSGSLPRLQVGLQYTF